MQKRRSEDDALMATRILALTKLQPPKKKNIPRAVQDMSWQKEAVCKSANPEIFVSPGDGDLVPESPYPNFEAYEYCDRCPVAAECLSFALRTESIGIWGRTTTYMRQQIRRKMTRKFCVRCKSSSIIPGPNVTFPESEICLSCGISWRI